MKRLPIVYSADPSGREYWRSVNEQKSQGAFRRAQVAEFPAGASEYREEEFGAGAGPNGVSRRGFMSIMGASLALAGLEGCRRPEEKILPYSRAQEEIVPGNPLYFATSFVQGGTAYGLLVESHEGRPTKIEGNPRHPESGGATGLFAQASVLDLYDPDRSTAPKERGTARTWEDAATFLDQLGGDLGKRNGRGLAVLVESHRSPTTARLLTQLTTALPEAKVVVYEAFSRHAELEGARLAFGEPLEAAWDLSRAQVIVALDADVLSSERSGVRAAREWSKGRSPEDSATWNRLYVAESAMTVTGSAADHRLRLPSGQIGPFVLALVTELRTKHGLDMPIAFPAPALEPEERKWVAAVAKDLAAHHGTSLLVAGEKQPPAVHALVHALNLALGNVGKTVTFRRPPGVAEGGPQAVVELAAAVRAKNVDTLLILGGNPAFDAPADADFAGALKQVPTSIHLATHANETSSLATWHLNAAHYLESWSDAQAVDGSTSIVQPLIAPLYGGKTAAEVISLVLQDGRRAHDLVRATWQRGDEVTFGRRWLRALHDGVLRDDAVQAVTPTVAQAGLARAVQEDRAPGGELELTFQADPHAYDGRFANNAWLQEFPDAMLKLTWGNVVAMSAATARELAVTDGDVVSIRAGRGAVELPVAIAPGHADRSISVTCGQGRRHVGRVGKGTGVDVYPLRTSQAFSVARGITVTKTGAVAKLHRTQEHFAMEGRPMIRSSTFEEYRRDPDFAKEPDAEHPPLISLYPDRNYENGHKWGMAIDLNACTGCGVCMVACQAENNIPIVGPEGVDKSREMHWLRIDRYYEGSVDDPTSVSQPMLCQQCENAPCEEVCPVGATSHGPEGLNEMAYNRCIGTRYCANNCPYKVRRFNFLNYHKDLTEQDKMVFNPEVTIRSRGVMEKCTFCVQRINHAKIDAKRSGHDRVEDGAIVTACQQACPTGAIQFGDLNDPKSVVAKRSSVERSYAVLEELNVRPRIAYLAKLRNPNPELEHA
jgi:MoCo/4Fe-4S cofactor protein with predicted Tat translocation signal